MHKTQAAFMRLCSRMNRRDAVARRKIATSLIWGVHGYIGKTTGSRMLLACALAGDTEARIDISTMPQSMLDAAFAPTETQRITWLVEAALAGDKYCARELGDWHGARGEKGEQAVWYRLAADLGDAEAADFSRPTISPGLPRTSL